MICIKKKLKEEEEEITLGFQAGDEACSRGYTNWTKAMQNNPEIVFTQKYDEI